MTKTGSSAKVYYVVIVIVTVLVISVAGAGYIKKKAMLAQAVPMQTITMAVRTIVAEKGEIERTVPALATVKSAATVQIKAETGGRILSLPLREGDRVKAGQVIGVIDSREQEAQLQAARARNESTASQVTATMAGLQVLTSQIDAAQTNLDFWAGQLRRDEQLLIEGAIAQNVCENTRNRHAEAASRLASLKSQIDSQKAQVDALHSQKKASEKDVAVWQVRLDYTELTAPINGVISARLQEEGNRIQPGATVYNIEDETKMRLIMQIPQDEATRIGKGQPVTVRGYEEACFTVSRVFPVINELRQVTVEAESENRCPGLIYDMQIPVHIIVERGDGTIIPQQARFIDFSSGDRFFVYVIKGGVAVRTPVKSVLEGDQGRALVDAAKIPAGTELAVGSYLENIRLPATFAVEVLR